MPDTDILKELDLPEYPIDSFVKIAVLSDEGNQRRFRVRIFRYVIEPTYIELSISVRRIKGVSFDRLLRRIENGKPFGQWIALAKIPAKDENDWIRQWQVLEFSPIPAAGG